jgi:hypothetical protein
VTDLKTLRPYFDRLAEDALVGAQGRARTPAPLVLASQDENADVIVVDIPRTPRGRTGRWRLAVAAAAAAALIVATIVVVRTESDNGGNVLTPAGPAPTAPAPAPTPAPTPFGAPLVVGPDAASTLLTSWGQFHGGGFVFVYADGRVIWAIGASVWADADGRVTAIPLAGPTEFGTFWLTESGLKPVSGTPEGEFVHGNIERRLSARGLELVRAGNIEVKHLLVHPDEQFPAELPRGPEDLNQWPIAIQLWLRPELWAGPARIWQPSTWAIEFHRFQYDPPSVEAVDATRALEQLPASAQALLTGKRRTCDYVNAGNAHWDLGPFRLDGVSTECFELNAGELAAFSASLDPNTFIEGSWHIDVDGRDAILNALPIYPHGQPQLFGG